MKLKNYTSGIPSQTTISHIEKLLMDAGATGIMKRVDSGAVVSLVFEIEDEQNINRLIKLPANVSEVHEYLWNDYITSHSRPKKSRDDFADQASRTAWRIVRDWVEIQVSMIKLRQMTVLQVFLPLIFDGRQTYYEYLQGNKFKSLPAPNGE